MGDDATLADGPGEDAPPSAAMETLREFLEQTPPGLRRMISDFAVEVHGTRYLNGTEISLHCPECSGERLFAPVTMTQAIAENFLKFINYRCRNCSKRVKMFALTAKREANGWSVEKIGEVPDFGSPTPARLLRLLDKDAREFLKGRRCEIQGFGIAAFAYYRRVVERRKNEIFDEIIRVTKIVEPSSIELLGELQAAKSQVQFTKAVDAIKHGLPPSLAINGSNPLTLLHGALSEGVHEYSDEECLDLAHSVRIVLIEFVDRLGQALRDDKGLVDAVKRLSGRKRAKPVQDNGAQPAQSGPVEG